MARLFPIVFLTALAAIPLLWLLLIRPYCIRNGGGYTPGASTWATMWVDWQHASETAATRGDRGMRGICRLFLACHFIALAALLVPVFLPGQA